MTRQALCGSGRRTLFDLAQRHPTHADALARWHASRVEVLAHRHASRAEVHARRHAHRAEEGSTLPLIAAFLALASALVIVVIAAGSLYLERKELFSLADGAASAGAESFPVEAIGGPERALPALESSRVRSAAEDYLRTAPSGQLDQLRIERADAAGTRTARVALSAWWRPPLVTLVLPEGVRIDVESTARSVLS